MPHSSDNFVGFGDIIKQFYDVVPCEQIIRYKIGISSLYYIILK